MTIVFSNQTAFGSARSSFRLRFLVIKFCLSFVKFSGFTFPFSGSVENVTVLIGVSAHGKAVAGIIHQPFYQKDVGRTFWGVVGLGAFGISTNKPDPDRLYIITSKSHWSEAIQEALQAFPEAKVTKAGGSGYKVMQVIEGNHDVYIYPRLGTKKWDSCAPEAILRSVGGTLTCLLYTSPSPRDS